MNKATIVYIVNKETNEVLMAKKTRKVGTGFYFGYGGKIEDGESPEASAVRETWQESGGEIENRVDKEQEGGVRIYEEELVPRALITFYRGKDEIEPTFEVLFYVTEKWDGTPIATEEMDDPKWFPIDNLPTDLKPGDEVILHAILRGDTVKGFFRFDKETNEVLDWDIKPCSPQELVL